MDMKEIVHDGVNWLANNRVLKQQTSTIIPSPYHHNVQRLIIVDPNKSRYFIIFMQSSR